MKPKDEEAGSCGQSNHVPLVAEGESRDMMTVWPDPCPEGYKRGCVGPRGLESLLQGKQRDSQGPKAERTGEMPSTGRSRSGQGWGVTMVPGRER